MIDQLEPAARERVDRAITVWLTTVTPSGQPQTMPVWFVVDGDEFLLYPGRARSAGGTSPRTRTCR